MWWSTRFFLFSLFPTFYFRSAFCLVRRGSVETLLWSGAADVLAAASFTFLAISLQVRFRSRAVVVISSLFWWGAHAALTTYFTAMHALPSIQQARYLLDLEFLSASFDISAIAAAFGAIAIVYFISHLDLRLVPIRGRARAAFVLLFAASLIPHWEENVNPIVFMARSLFLKEPASEVPSPACDLSGSPLLSFPETAARPNVLLVVLEGIPGGYLPQNVSFAKSSADFSMPKTGRWAERGLCIPNFLAHRNQTINGLYSMLCADYPRLSDGTPVVQELLANPSANERDYLPEILALNGYHTAYLQAAGLRFMDKDRFMKLIGFEEVLGEEWFAPGPFFSRWGINDRDFFVQSLKKIRDLEERRRGRGRPWFLTLLTVGTHHPYALPEDYRGGEESLPPKLRSVQFLDDAVDLFLSRLEEEGLLEETLVIVTSDESHGMDADILLAGNWGLCFALTPGGEGEVNPGLFGLIDLPLSILDYVGFAASADAVGGRSIFREYGNTKKRALAGSWGSRFFVVSGDAVFLKDFGCEDFVALPFSGSPFALANDAKPLGSGTPFTAWASPSEKHRPALTTWRFLPDGSSFKSVDCDDEPLPVDSKLWLSGGQYIQLRKGERYVLELDVAAPRSNARELTLDWLVYSLNGAEPFLSNARCPLPPLAPGERLSLSCSVEVREDFMLDSASFAALVRPHGPGPGASSIDIGTFALRQVPATEPRPTGKPLYDGADAHFVLKSRKVERQL